MEAMMKLKDQGKIRAIGASNVTSDIIRGYCKYGQLDVIQEKYSLLTRRVEKQLLPTCKELGVSVQAYSPLEQGSADRQGDHGHHLPGGQHPQLEPQLPARTPGTGPCHAEQLAGPDREVPLHHGPAGHRPDRPHGARPVRAVRCPHPAAG